MSGTASGGASPSGSAQTKDFFISYTGTNVDWAAWIAHELEAAGYTTIYQERDIPVGSNFILEMHEAMCTTKRTIAVLSPEYFRSGFAQAEWAEAVRRDPSGKHRLLLPVRVSACEPDGIFGARVYCDLVGLNEIEARERLLANVKGAIASGAAPSPGVRRFERLFGRNSGSTSTAENMPGKRRGTMQAGTTSGDKVLCPYCFEFIHPGECAVFSRRRGGVMEPNPKEGKKHKIKDLAGPLYVREQAVWQCSNCSQLWPTGYEQAENHIIAVLGTPGAGVSTYIAMLIHELRNARILQAIGATRFSAIDEETDHRYHQDYFEDFIRNHRMFPATQPAFGDLIRPLIYQLHFPGSSKDKAERTINLLFYDVASEDISRERNLVESCRFLFHASAMIFLADPAIMPDIRKNILPQHLPPQQPHQTPEDLLSRVIRIYDRYYDGNAISIPLAITLSKSDLLSFHDPQRRSVLFTQPAFATYPTRRQRWLEEFERINSTVRYMLTAIGERSLIVGSSSLERVNFFAVSATGWPPDPQTGTYPAIEPLRVLDPLLWVLYELGVIQAE